MLQSFQKAEACALTCPCCAAKDQRHFQCNVEAPHYSTCKSMIQLSLPTPKFTNALGNVTPNTISEMQKGEITRECQWIAWFNYFSSRKSITGIVAVPLTIKNHILSMQSLNTSLEH